MNYIAALLILIILLFPLQSSAQEDGDKWIRKTSRSSCEWWETCPRYYYRRHVHRLPAVRVYAPRQNDALCHPSITVVGRQGQSEENAWAHAVESWQGAVRFRHGEIFMAITMADDIKRLCGPSSVSDTATAKLQDKVFGIEYYRCEITAKPCRPRRRED